MPRDGSNIYSQPFPDVVEDTTIESTVYNGFTNDVAQDLNAPRPIVAGGTGATNARDAMIALSGEIASQVVTNYDSFPFVAGSFYSAAGATSAPSANAVSGICHSMGANGDMMLEARDNTTGRRYSRGQTGGVWGLWIERPGSIADLDAAYVNVTGDAMTGGLSATGFSVGNTVIGPTSFELGSTTAAGPAFIDMHSSGTTSDYDVRFLSTGGSATAGSGTLTVYSGSSVFSSQLQVNSNIVANSGDFIAQKTTTTGAIFFGTSGIKQLLYDGSNFFLQGGSLYASNSLYATGDLLAGASSLTVGTVRFGTNGNNYLNHDGTNFNLIGGAVLNTTLIQAVGYKTRAGATGGYGGNQYVYNWTGTIQAWIDTSNVGTLAYTSDYRTKKDVTDLPGTWETVKALRPIKYTQAQFSPPSHVKYIAEETIKARKEAEENPEAKPREVNTGSLFEADDIERWGFIAHELQETLTPSAASGEKDSPDTVQSPNPWTVIAALTKALQEAMARIEALEAK